MNARADILARVRRRIGRDRPASEQARREVDRRLTERPVGPRPVIRGELLNAFIDRAESLSSSVEVVDERDEVPGAVAAYLRAQGLPCTAAVWPELMIFDWAGAQVAVQPAGACDGDEVGITGVFCAIAETGTLMLCSGPNTAATTSLLPATHIAVVDATRIVAGMEDAFALLRWNGAQLPRAVNFVSGPSRTGDIEQTIVIGAHGPSRVHVVVF